MKEALRSRYSAILVLLQVTRSRQEKRRKGSLPPDNRLQGPLREGMEPYALPSSATYIMKGRHEALHLSHPSNQHRHYYRLQRPTTKAVSEGYEGQGRRGELELSILTMARVS